MPLINVTDSLIINRAHLEKEVSDLYERLMKVRKFGLNYVDQLMFTVRHV